MLRCLLSSALILWLLLCTGGCQSKTSDDSQPGTPSPQQPTQDDTSIGAYERSELSEIGAYLPDLDDGRLRVAPPVDWQPASRSKDYVARFVFDRQSPLPLPLITVTAEDADPDAPRNLTPANVAEYAAAVNTQLDESTRGAITSPVEPLILADIPVARFVQTKTFRPPSGRLLRGEREVLQTIRDGRVYRVVLDANVTTLVRYRADAYAVMASLQFPLAKPVDDEASEDASDDMSNEPDSAGDESQTEPAGAQDSTGSN